MCSCCHICDQAQPVVALPLCGQALRHVVHMLPLHGPSSSLLSLPSPCPACLPCPALLQMLGNEGADTASLLGALLEHMPSLVALGQPLISNFTAYAAQVSSAGCRWQAAAAELLLPRAGCCCKSATQRFSWIPEFGLGGK